LAIRRRRWSGGILSDQLVESVIDEDGGLVADHFLDTASIAIVVVLPNCLRRSGIGEAGLMILPVERICIAAAILIKIPYSIILVKLSALRRDPIGRGADGWVIAHQCGSGCVLPRLDDRAVAELVVGEALKVVSGLK
jgi:hypothetical protein